MGLFTSKKGRISAKWEYNTNSNLLAGPMVYDVNKDGKKEIVFGTKDGRIILMDEDSKVQWIYDIKEDVSEAESYFQDTEMANSIEAQPAIADVDKDGMNEIIFGTEMGIVYALDHEGRVRWKYKADDAIRSAVTLFDINNDGVLEVIFGCMNGNVYVLSSVGRLIWKHTAGSSVESTPVVLPTTSRILFGCHDGNLQCVNMGGEVAWNFKTEGKIVSQPVVADLFGDGRNYIIFGSTDFHLYVLTEEGELVWKYKTAGAILSKVAVADINSDGKNEIVFGSCDNNVYALTNRGDKIWSYETYFWVVAPPIIDDIDNDGKMEVIVGSYDHNLYILDGEGIYTLDYVPGLGGVVNQSGHYNELMTSEPGNIIGKKIWQYQTGGFIVGCDLDQDLKNIVVNIKEGIVNDLIHEK